MFTLCVSHCRSLVTQAAVINPSAVTSPVSQSCTHPNLFNGILSGNQINVCKRDSKLLSTIAIGVLRSLNVCQKLFKDRPWNCSVFESGPYLGAFIEQGAFPYTVIAAACVAISLSIYGIIIVLYAPRNSRNSLP